MIQFFTEYGLFLLKSVTVVVAALVIIGAAFSTSSKGRRQEDEGHIVIKALHEEYKGMRETLQSSILSKAELKKLTKQRKAEEKAEQKAGKKAQEGKEEDTEKQRLFVIDFDGDMKVSSGDKLAHEISAILSVATSNDEVLVRLESPGGMVHAYGLAASQLDRIRKKEIPLTIAVDKVAASGGYLMASLGTRIIAAPFAIIGSIGVVAQIPNFHRLLKKNDVDVEVLTAGEYKRTLTIFGENTESGRSKFIEDLEDTHVLFKEFVSEHRPQLDMEKVATGEHWYGTRAMALQLIDEIMTSDEYLMSRADEVDMYVVGYELKKPFLERLSTNIQTAVSDGLSQFFHRSQSPKL